jgi:prolyl oligopeptidase
VSNGDGGEYELYLLESGKPWRKVAGFADQVIHGEFGDDGLLYLLSRQSAPMGKLIRVPVADPVLARAQTVVPESKAAIDQYLLTRQHLFIADLIGGPSQIRVFDRQARFEKMVPLPPVSSVLQLAQDPGSRAPGSATIPNPDR